MVRPLITFVILCLTVAVGIRADAGGGGGLKVGQVKLSAPIPVTLTLGDNDIFNFMLPFDHPDATAPGAVNFTPVLKQIQLPDQTLSVQDFFLLDNQWNGACPALVGTLHSIIQAYAQSANDTLGMTLMSNQLKDVIQNACSEQLKASKALDTESAWAAAPINPAWCTFVHAVTAMPANDEALHDLCMAVHKMDVNFGTTNKFSGICGEYLGCGSMWCPAAKVECMQEGWMTSFVCRQHVFEDGSDYCMNFDQPLQQCLHPETLCQGKTDAECADRKNLCGELIDSALVGGACADKGYDVATPNQCKSLASDFHEFCTPTMAIAFMVDMMAPENTTMTCEEYFGAMQKTFLQSLSVDPAVLAKFQQTCAQPEAQLCPSDNFSACSAKKAVCGMLNNQYPLNRLLTADVRADGLSPAVPDVSKVRFSAERAAPYLGNPVEESFPASLFAMTTGAVVGGDDWADGIVTVFRNPGPVVNIQDAASVPTVPASIAARLGYFRFQNQPGVPLVRHSVSPGFWGPETTEKFGQKCVTFAKGAPPSLAALQKLGCVMDKIPVAVAALNLFGVPDDKTRDLVVINQGPLSYEPVDAPPVAFATIYKKRAAQVNPNEHGYSTGNAWTDLWTYHVTGPDHGFLRLSGLRPMGHCVYGNDVYIAINRPGKDGKFYVDKITYDQTAGEVKAVPIPVEPSAIKNNQQIGYGPYGIACGNFSGDQAGIADFALTWAKMDKGTMLDFQSFVTVHAGKADGSFTEAPYTTITALAVQEDKKNANAADAELAATTGCDLDKNGVDDLCVGDQHVYTVDAKKSVYMMYFPFGPVGLPNLDLAQLHQLNIKTDYLPENGWGGVRQLVVDRHQNVGAVIKELTFYQPDVTITCMDRDADTIPDVVWYIAVDGANTPYAQIVDPELKQIAEKSCNQDNCPGDAPPGFVMPKACDGTQKTEDTQHPCFNSGQADWDKDGFGNVCDDTPGFPPFNPKVQPELIKPKLVPQQFDKPKFELPPEGP